MSSCLSGGGGRAAYGFDLDIVVKSSSSSPTTSSSRSTHSSPSSTLSEACNSPLAISTKRARTPRKRPNQTYNEAAALLSTVYPSIFSAKSLPKLCKKKNSRPSEDAFSEPIAELLPPFPAIGDAGFLLQQYVPDEPSPRIELRPTSSSERSSACLSPASADLPEADSPGGLVDDDFDAESILDEEVGEGIDSIMGNLSFKPSNGGAGGGGDLAHPNPLFGYGIGGIFKFRHGYRGNMRRALKRADDGEWWRSPTVEVLKIAPKLKPAAAPPPSPTADKKKKKKVQKVERVDKVLDRAARVGENTEEEEAKEKTQPPPVAAALKPSLSLKLNYEDVLKAWSGRGSPFSGDVGSSEDPADNIVRPSLLLRFTPRSLVHSFILHFSSAFEDSSALHSLASPPTLGRRDCLRSSCSRRRRRPPAASGRRASSATRRSGGPASSPRRSATRSAR